MPAAAAVHQRLHHLRGERGCGREDAVVAHGGQCEAHVLSHQLRPEAGSWSMPSMMRLAWFSITKDRAEPPSSAWRIAAGSSPALRPSASASDTARTVAATISWLADLQTCPAPEGPRWVRVLPTASNTGLGGAKASGVATDHAGQRAVPCAARARR